MINYMEKCERCLNLALAFSVPAGLSCIIPLIVYVINGDESVFNWTTGIMLLLFSTMIFFFIKAIIYYNKIKGEKLI